MPKNIYQSNGEWSGFSVRQSCTGYVVNGWSRIEGERDGWRALLPFSADFPVDMELSAKWNDSFENGFAIGMVARHRGRMLRKGTIVQ